MTLAPGPIIFLIYDQFISYYPEYALALLPERKSLSTIIAGFSFTMLGFMGAIVTILFTFNNSETIKSFSRVGYMDIFFRIYYLTIICLIVTAFLSLYGFSSTAFILPFKLMIISFVNNLIQVMVITIMIINLARNAAHEGEEETED